MSPIRKFLKSSSIFILGSALSKVIVFFLLPIYTRHIPTSDYGYYDVSLTYLSLLSAATFFEIWSTTLRFMFQSPEKQYKYKIVSNGLTLFFVFFLLFTSIIFIVRLTVPIRYFWLIYLYGATLTLSNMYLFIARGLNLDFVFAVSGIVNTIISAGLSVVLIVGLHMDFSALYLTGILGNVAQILFLEWKTKVVSNISVRSIDPSFLKQMLKYTLPLCLNTTAYWILSGYSRIVINSAMSLSANGIYAIGNKFAYVIVFATNCFTYAWQGVTFERGAEEKGGGAFYSKACTLYLEFLATAVILAIPLFNLVFPYLVDKAYLGAAAIMPLFLINACMYAYAQFVDNIFATLKKTKVVFFTMGISCVLHLALSYPLIHIWGLNGINLSVFISYFINILIGYLLLKKYMEISIHFKIIASVFALVGISVLISAELGRWFNLLWFLLCAVSLGYFYKDRIKSMIGPMADRIRQKW